MKDLSRLLKNTWLWSNEIKVYLAILETPKSNISEISRNSLVKRTTVYLALESLLESGFISKTVKGKVILYVPENPDAILHLFEEKKRNLEKSMPLLKDLFHQNKVHNDIRMFTWRKQIDNLYEIVASSSTEIYAFFSPSKYHKIFWKGHEVPFNTYVLGRRVKLYDLVEHTVEWKEYLKSVEHSWRLLPKEFENNWMDMLIFEDQVAIVLFDSLTGILIKDKNISSFMRTMFKCMWKGLK